MILSANDAVNCDGMKGLTWRWRFLERKMQVWPSRSTVSLPLTPAVPRALPRPALRWVGPGNKIALRPIDWNCDADTICLWQRETYALNFPGFQFTETFSNAFRHDLRRASLDDQHGLFILDERASGGGSCGFVWLVICHNSWTNERYGYINNLYIVPEKRGSELGSALLDYADEWFRRRRIAKLRLTVTSSNQSACRLYEKNGYEITRWEMEKESGHGL